MPHLAGLTELLESTSNLCVSFERMPDTRYGLLALWHHANKKCMKAADQSVTKHMQV